MFVRSGRPSSRNYLQTFLLPVLLPVLVAGRKSSRRIQTVSLRLPASFSICQRPASVEIGPPFRVEDRQLKRWRVEPPDWAAFLLDNWTTSGDRRSSGQSAPISRQDTVRLKWAKVERIWIRIFEYSNFRIFANMCLIPRRSLYSEDERRRWAARVQHALLLANGWWKLRLQLQVWNFQNSKIGNMYISIMHLASLSDSELLG